MTPPPGSAVAEALLADRYRLLERIAVGGMGEVWRAQDALLGRLVAVKTLKPEHLADEDFRARFRAEARHAGGLAHAGIASVYDYGEDDGRAFLVMELVEGEPLSALLRAEGALSADRTLDLLSQTAAALHAAHLGGVVHRDVKPGNLLVRPDGVLKITDFGVASAAGAVPLTQTGTVVGTAFYLSPEQAAGRSATPASDLYSLGVVAYECLTGRRPFPGDNPVAVALAHLQAAPPALPGAVPAPVRLLVEQLLAKDPDDRPLDAAEVSRRASALRERLAAAPQPASESGGLAALPVDPPHAVRPPDPGEAELAPTGVLPVAARLPRPARTTPGSRARSSRNAVTAVAALLALLAVALGSLRATPADAQVVVPRVIIGMPEAQAATLLAGVDLPVQRSTAPSLSIPAGAVLSLLPASGSRVAPGTELRLVVSEGPPPVRLDPAGYVGQPVEQVRVALAELGLVPRLAYDGSGTPVGTVSDVEPTGELPRGSSVLVHAVPEPAPVAPAPAGAPAPAPVAEEPAQAPAPVAEPLGATKGSGGKGDRGGAGKGKGGK